jgi:hypothetical protein
MWAILEPGGEKINLLHCMLSLRRTLRIPANQYSFLLQKELWSAFLIGLFFLYYNIIFFELLYSLELNLRKLHQLELALAPAFQNFMFKLIVNI